MQPIIRETYAFIRESFALIREKYNFFLYETDPNRIVQLHCILFINLIYFLKSKNI